MNIKIESNCLFSVSAIHYSATGELCITLNSDNTSPEGRYQYTASLGSGQAEEKPTISLLQYAKAFAASANVKYKTKDSYRLMCGHLEKYGDIPIDKVILSGWIYNAKKNMAGAIIIWKRRYRKKLKNTTCINNKESLSGSCLKNNKN
jgi:hypothetical protein